MPVSPKDVAALLSSSALEHVENQIAAAVGLPICREDVSLFASLLKQEIDASGIEVNELVDLLSGSRELLVAFGTRLLHGEEQPRDTAAAENEGLACGFGITYAIYLHYLSNKSQQDLVQYVKVRRIPQAKKFAERLKKTYDAVM
jgi:hypothetical protein